MKNTIASLCLIAVALVVGGCTDPEKARKALDGAGYTNIELHGHAFSGCGDEDGFSDKFTATGPTGKHVEGVVCSGVFKGATIRIE